MSNTINDVPTAANNYNFNGKVVMLHEIDGVVNQETVKVELERLKSVFETTVIDSTVSVLQGLITNSTLKKGYYYAIPLSQINGNGQGFTGVVYLLALTSNTLASSCHVQNANLTFPIWNGKFDSKYFWKLTEIEDHRGNIITNGSFDAIAAFDWSINCLYDNSVFYKLEIAEFALTELGTYTSQKSNIHCKFGSKFTIGIGVSVDGLLVNNNATFNVSYILPYPITNLEVKRNAEFVVKGKNFYSNCMILNTKINTGSRFVFTPITASAALYLANTTISNTNIETFKSLIWSGCNINNIKSYIDEAPSEDNYFSMEFLDSEINGLFLRYEVNNKPKFINITNSKVHNFKLENYAPDSTTITDSNLNYYKIDVLPQSVAGELFYVEIINCVSNVGYKNSNDDVVLSGITASDFVGSSDNLGAVALINLKNSVIDGEISCGKFGTILIKDTELKQGTKWNPNGYMGYINIFLVDSHIDQKNDSGNNVVDLNLTAFEKPTISVINSNIYGLLNVDTAGANNATGTVSIANTTIERGGYLAASTNCETANHLYINSGCIFHWTANNANKIFVHAGVFFDGGFSQDNITVINNSGGSFMATQANTNATLTLGGTVA